MAVAEYTRLATIKTVEAFRELLSELGLNLPCVDRVEPDGALFQPLELYGKQVGNRFAIQPMEGWDGDTSGNPTDLTIRRWRRFGASGAKLIWGGEAVAVRQDGRANPHQLLVTDNTQSGLEKLLIELRRSHIQVFGTDDDLLVGLQLTHSGRFSRPNPDGVPQPVRVFGHPLLDLRLGEVELSAPISDNELHLLAADFVSAGIRAWNCGFQFVDIKHCHGYLGHELLGAHSRLGDYGGSLDNRLRFLREIVSGLKATVPGLGIGVRLSAFDMVPYCPDATRSSPGRPGPGVPVDYCDAMPYAYGFGVDAEQPMDIDLTEPILVLKAFREMGITAVNITGGSPYYNPHIQRPALYPPSDGYLPPEDPLVGVARHMSVVRALKRSVSGVTLIGSGYSYLQEFLPNVGEAAVGGGWVDCVGLGRMALSYPDLPRDIAEGKTADRKRICRTFSDCTTAPRNGLHSGCYPLDPYYKSTDEAAELKRIKQFRNANV